MLTHEYPLLSELPVSPVPAHLLIRGSARTTYGSLAAATLPSEEHSGRRSEHLSHLASSRGLPSPAPPSSSRSQPALPHFPFTPTIPPGVPGGRGGQTPPPPPQPVGAGPPRSWALSKWRRWALPAGFRLPSPASGPRARAGFYLRLDRPRSQWGRRPWLSDAGPLGSRRPEAGAGLLAPLLGGVEAGGGAGGERGGKAPGRGVAALVQACEPSAAGK